jgi:hypothetical protein
MCCFYFVENQVRCQLTSVRKKRQKFSVSSIDDSSPDPDTRFRPDHRCAHHGDLLLRPGEQGDRGQEGVRPAHSREGHRYQVRSLFIFLPL